MKCDNWIDPTKTSKKGHLLKSAFVGTRESGALRGNEARECRGNIIAQILVVNEPYFGGTSASLEIEYTCGRCKQPLYGPRLPRESDELAAILTEYIANKKDDATRKVTPPCSTEDR